jgi:hypothetical protein
MIPVRRAYWPSAASVLVGSAICIAATLAVCIPAQLGDAWMYTVIGEDYVTAGFRASGRTYPYPAFIAAWALLFGVSGERLVVTVVAVQTAAFCGAVAWLESLLRPRNPLFAATVAAALLLNPIIIDLLSSTLTEAPTVVLTVLMVCCLLRADTTEQLRWLVIGSGLAALAWMTRPANVILLVSWHAAAAFVLRSYLRRWLAYVVLSIVVTGAAAAPQVYLNVRHHGVYSPMGPPLLAQQVNHGIRLWKYGTIIEGGQAKPLNYVNPIFTEWPKDAPDWMWYFENPMRGAATIAAHVFNGFTFDFPRTYVRDREFPAALFAGPLWAVFAFGCVELVRRAKRLLRLPHVAAIAYVAIACFLTTAMIAVTAVENRFAVVPASALIVAAGWGVVRPGWDRGRTIALIAAGFVGLAGAIGATLMRGIMTSAPCC